MLANRLADLRCERLKEHGLELCVLRGVRLQQRHDLLDQFVLRICNTVSGYPIAIDLDAAASAKDLIEQYWRIEVLDPVLWPFDNVLRQ